MDTGNIKVDIWLDFVCPFCYIGKRNFEIALEDFSPTNHIEVKFRSFLLDPDSPVVTQQDLHQHLVQKKAISYEEAKAMTEKVTLMGKEVDLDFQMDKVIVANSRDSHQLMHYASAQGLATTVTDLLLKAYFTQGRNIADIKTLLEIAAQAGLDESEAERKIKKGAFNHQIEKDIYEAKLADVRGVPFFLFNEKMAVPGALPASSFKNVLEKVIKTNG